MSADRANVAERVLLALADEQGPVFPRTLQRDLKLSRSSVSRGLYALLIIGFAERGVRHRQGVLWSLTPAGRRAIGGMVGSRQRFREAFLG